MKQKRLGIILLCAAVVLGMVFTSCDIGGDGDDGSGIEIWGCEPATGIVNEALAVAITGNGLSDDVAPNKQVSLVAGAEVIYGSNVQTITGGQVNVDFDLTGAALGTYALYISDDDGDEQSFPDAFTIDEYEIVQEALDSLQQIDVSGGNVSFDFSSKASCDGASDVRDVTFILDGSTDPALTITAGGHGGIVYYPAGFPSLEEATDVEADYNAYARDGDTALPMPLNDTEYYTLIDAAEPDYFIILEVNSVDKGADTIDVNYMIVRKISTGGTLS